LDRQLIGVLAVSLVAATLVTLIAAAEKERILVSGVFCPEYMAQSSAEYCFGVSFITTRNLADVEVRACTLSGLTPESFGLKPDEQDPELYPPISILREESSRLGVEIQASRFELNGDSSSQQIVYYDFLPLLERLFIDPARLPLGRITTCYGFFRRAGKLETCFKGSGEIFPAESSSLNKILVEVDGRPRYGWERGTGPERQARGIRVGEVTKGSRVDVLYYIDGRWARVGSLLWKLDVIAGGEVLYSRVRLINVAGSA